MHGWHDHKWTLYNDTIQRNCSTDSLVQGFTIKVYIWKIHAQNTCPTMFVYFWSTNIFNYFCHGTKLFMLKLMSREIMTHSYSMGKLPQFYIIKIVSNPAPKGGPGYTVCRHMHAWKFLGKNGTPFIYYNYGLKVGTAGSLGGLGRMSNRRLGTRQPTVYMEGLSSRESYRYFEFTRV